MCRIWDLLKGLLGLKSHMPVNYSLLVRMNKCWCTQKVMLNHLLLKDTHINVHIGNLLDTVHDRVLDSSGHDQLNKMADKRTSTQ